LATLRLAKQRDCFDSNNYIFELRIPINHRSHAKHRSFQ
jgi:hypothetical protein